MQNLDKRYPCILVDLDGTMFDNQHRAGLIPPAEQWGNPNSWDRYEREALHDKPKRMVIDIVKRMYEAGNINVIFVTARFANHWRIAIAQLHSVAFHLQERSELFMRPVNANGEQQSPADFKALVVDQLAEDAFNVVWAIDDSPSVIAALEAKAVQTFRVVSSCGATAIEMAKNADNLPEEVAAHRQTKEKLARHLTENVELKATIERQTLQIEAFEDGGDGIRQAADTYYLLRDELNLPRHASLVDVVTRLRERHDKLTEAAADWQQRTSNGDHRWTTDFFEILNLTE